MKYLCLILLATSVAGRFTEDLYRLLAKKNPQSNLIVSPLSVEIAMSMAYMGAEGQTADELRSVLYLSKNKKAVARKYRKLLSDVLDRGENSILELANRIYVNDKYRLVPNYNEVVRDSFKAEAMLISFEDPDMAAAIVNNWVSNQTRGKITELVSSDDTGPDTAAVLLNAIYFKGQWGQMFNKEDTTEGKFQISKNEEITAQMMSLTGDFKVGYLHDLGAQVIELPYHNSTLSMVIFLPYKVDGLRELEDKISGFSRTLGVQNVDLTLPKFKIEFEEELKEPLAKLGIREAFGGGANFHGLVDNAPVSIGKVIHKAFIEVNEEGAEAAAATAFTTVLKTGGPRPMPFIADHPFAYIIRDKNTVYFQGHVVRP